MKKILVACFLMLGIAIQSVAAPKIILEDKKENYTQTDHGYNLLFKLVATNEELSAIMTQVEGLKDRLSLQLSEGSGNTYDCIFTINHQNQPEYVHKMLLAIGIGELEYKGNTQSVDAITQILKSYL